METIFYVNHRIHQTHIGWILGLTWINPFFYVNHKFRNLNHKLHSMSVGWNLELTWNIPTALVT